MRLKLSATAIVLLAIGAYAAIPSHRVVAWEHGWKTDYVVATRYSNPNVGYNIGFTYPRNPNDCDRSELSEFMEAHGGFVYQGGGYPGAEMFVVFKDVKNRDDADRKLKGILPSLSKLVASY